MVSGSGDGDDFLPGGSRVQERELAQEFIEKNLLLLAKLHRAGAIHGGFTPRNELYILNNEASDTGKNRLQIVWIDLATCRKVPFFKRKKLQQKDVDCFLSMLKLSPENKDALYQFYFKELKK